MQRVIDLVICIFIFIPLTIVLLGIALLIIFFDGFPVLFNHRRVGKNEKEFLTYKFKTYKPIQGKNDYIIVDHKRAETTVSPLGRILRDHGLDELPQLLNVILGQMTFIGPRPLVDFTYEDLKNKYPDKVNLIKSWKKKRLEYVPGISGWHQIHVDDPHVIKFENEYWNDPSLSKKVKIIINSILILVVGKAFFLRKNVATSNQYKV